MESKQFINRSFDIQIRKFEDIRNKEIDVAAEKANFNATINISEILYQKALAYPESYEELRLFFKNALDFVFVQRVNKGDDWIKEASISFDDYYEAAKFLAACKLFVGVSSSYSMNVERYKFSFYFNFDKLRVEDIYEEE